MTKNLSDKYLLFILGVIGAIYLRSSWGKISGGNFVENLDKTLGVFSNKNPYPLVKDFLTNTAIPNSNIFGLLTMWGEFLVGITLIMASLYLIFNPKRNTLIVLLLIAGLVAGMFLSGTFWLAAGWTSPSTESVNLLMFVVQLTGLIYGLKRLKE